LRSAPTSQDNSTFPIIDQEIRQALRIADYVYVLELGRKKFDGEAGQIGVWLAEGIGAPPSFFRWWCSGSCLGLWSLR
jgi:hypothetical protein